MDIDTLPPPPPLNKGSAAVPPPLLKEAYVNVLVRTHLMRHMADFLTPQA